MRSFLLRLEGYYKRMPERDQKIFPYFLFICLFILFYYGLIMPAQQKTAKFKQENDNLEQKVFMLKSKVSVLDTVKLGMKKRKKDYDRLEKEFYRLKKRVPSADEVSQIIKTLAKAEKVDYFLREVDEKNYIKHKDYVEIPLSVHLNGDYYHALDFFRTLEKSERFFLINGVSFTADDEINGNVSVNFDISAFKIMDLDYYINLYIRKSKEGKNGGKKGKK